MGSNKGSSGGAPNAGSTFSNTQSNLSNASNSTSAGAQITSPTPEAMAAYSRLLGEADYWKNITTYVPQMDQQVAPLNDLMNYGLSNMYTTGRDAGSFDPAKVQAIESPYTKDVVNATQGWFNNQNAIQGDNLLGNAIKSGNAFGGDRAGVAEAQLGGQQQLAQAPVIAGLNQAGYTQALQEYNTLKQLGLTGSQQAVQAGSILQQHEQQGLDAQRQNSIARTAFMPELLNWYASMVGNLGPLEGSESVATGTTASAGSATNTGSGNTTPPAPNGLAQGLGLASSAIGLGRSFFGKRGGLVQMANGGGVNDSTTNVLSDAGTAFMSTGPFGSPHIGRSAALPSAKLPTAQNPPTPTTTPPPAQTQNNSSSNSDNSFLGGLGNVLSLGAKVAPLLLLRRGGIIPGLAGGGPIRLKRRYDDGGDVDFDFNTDATAAAPAIEDDVFNGYDPGRNDKYGPDENLTANGMTDKKTDNTADDNTSDDATLIPVHAGLAQGDLPASGSPAGLPDIGETASRASGSPAGLPELDMANAGGPNDPDQPRVAGGLTDTPDVMPEASSTRVPGLAATDMSAQSRRPTVSDAGPRRSAASTRQIPGLGKAPSTFASRAASDPFLAAGIAMLKNRSPYFGVGLGAGLEGAQGALATTAKQEQLDAKPQMITNGDTVQFRVGDKMIDTGIRTQTAAQKAQREDRQLDRESREKISRERQDAISGRSGTPSKTEGGKLERERDAEVRRLMQMELKTSKDSGQDMTTDEAEYRAIKRWNKRNPERALPEPDAPAPKAAPAKPKEEPGVIQRGWDYLTKPDPNAPKTAPVTPETKPPGVPEVKAPAVPDLKTALATGKTTPEEAKAQAKAAIARNPGARQAVIDRLKAANIDVSDLTAAPVMPVVPISQ